MGGRSGGRRECGGHLINEISYSEDKILCVCEWLGAIDDFREHQKTSEPTNNKVTDNRFKSRLILSSLPNSQGQQ